jgi:hypothetical protein
MSVLSPTVREVGCELDVACDVLGDAARGAVEGAVGLQRVESMMSRMSELDVELRRVYELDMAVRSYLSHLASFEQGAEHDGSFVEYWREQLEMLTCGEPLEVE